MKRPLKTYLTTVALWLIVCIGYNGWRLATYTPNPLDRDFYAHDSGYQFIMLIIFQLPIWIVALLLILCVEMVVFKSRETSSS